MRMNLNKIILGYNKKSMFVNLSKDLQIQETQQFPLQLSLKDIHNQLKNLRFESFYQSTGGMNNKNEALEKAHLIPFNLMYYYLFITNQQIPTPQHLSCEYVYRFCEKSKELPHYYKLKTEYQQDYSNILFTLEELTGRICRAYNSFNREVELAFRLMEETDLLVRYSFKEDYIEGIDLGISYNHNDKIGVACYQNNLRTKYFKELKETTRRKNYDVNNIISMAIDKNNHDLCGEIWIYSQAEYNKLKQEIYKRGSTIDAN